MSFLSQQPAAVASTSLPPRTCSARAVQHTASMTARAHGAATVRMATIEPCPTPRLWPAPVRLHHTHPFTYTWEVPHCSVRVDIPVHQTYHHHHHHHHHGCCLLTMRGATQAAVSCSPCHSLYGLGGHLGDS